MPSDIDYLGLIKNYATRKLDFNISKDIISFLDRKVYTDENQHLHTTVYMKENCVLIKLLPLLLLKVTKTKNTSKSFII